MEAWRINLRTQSLQKGTPPESWQRIGGRGLLARILLDEVPPLCDPYGPYNKLIFAPGLLVGHMLSSLDRISIGAKSPLTGGVKEANAGGSTGLHLTNLGIHSLILEDRPEGDAWWVLHLSKDGALFDPAGDVVGLGVFDSAKKLLERYGKDVAIALIGPAGEMRLTGAGIQNLDKDRVPARIAARGGLGALMGSRHLKAIVIDDSGGEKAPIADLAAFRAAQKEYNKALMAHPQTKVYTDFGTIAVGRLCQTFGALPVRNFSAGQLMDLEPVSAEHMRGLLLERDGEADTSHACMRGCTIRSSNVYAGADGKAIVSPLEYETIGLMGMNLGITDLDVIARLNARTNDLGLDTIETGAALGVAMEAGLAEFGDGEGAMRLLEEIEKGTPLGRIIGMGAAVTGKVLGVERVPVVKNQAISAYDPRAIKGTGITYATSPQGADHTAGLTIRAKVDHTSPNGQKSISLTAQINMAGYDTLGACIFAGFGFSTAPHVIRDLLNARYGWQVGEDILQVLGRETLKLELEFNRRAGFTAADNRLPEWMTREPLAPTNAVFDVPEEDLDTVFDW